MLKYQLAALGGTFDHLHRGHEYLFQTAFETAKKVIIGLAEKNLYQNKEYNELIESYDLRKRAVEQLVGKMGWGKRVEMIPLKDIFGPTLSDNRIDCLVVTEQTKKGAELINEERRKQGLEELPVKVARLIKDGSGRYISSTRIRLGEINREGVVYERLFAKTIWIKQEVREELRKIQGEMINEDRLAEDVSGIKGKICLVGDGVTATFNRLGLPYDYAVIDQRLERKVVPLPIIAKDFVVRKAKNQAGTIEVKAALEVLNLKDWEKIMLVVEGEEDLLALPAVMGLPLGSVVFYGQPGQGVIRLWVQEDLKQRMSRLVAGESF